MADMDAVELVSADGLAIGTSTVAAAHRPPGQLHRAFSVVLLSGDGRVLLQRRAAAKRRFALAWANTCCGHPAPGEPVPLAAVRRLHEELGVAIGMPPPLAEAGVVRYAAQDTQSGQVETEYDHVLYAFVSPSLALSPSPDEVCETSWVPLGEVMARRWPVGAECAPWLLPVLRLVAHLA